MMLGLPCRVWPIGWVVLALAGCSAEAEKAENKSGPKLSVNALSQRVELLLSGNAASCQSDAECSGAVCYYGRCLGLLQVDQRWSQQRIVAGLDKLVQGSNGAQIRPQLVERLSEFLVRPDADVAWRARAIAGLEVLGETSVLAKTLKHSDDRVRAAAALALTRQGDSRGIPLTVALTESEQTHVAVEALHALGAREGSDEALTALLSALSEDIDRMLVRAAVEALGKLGDKRAIRPLVGFLERGPDHLAHRTVRVLRKLTGLSAGIDPRAWNTWVTQHNPPKPPPFQLRTSSDEADFGMPDF